MAPYEKAKKHLSSERCMFLYGEDDTLAQEAIAHLRERVSKGDIGQHKAFCLVAAIKSQGISGVPIDTEPGGHDITIESKDAAIRALLEATP